MTFPWTLQCELEDTTDPQFLEDEAGRIALWVAGWEEHLSNCLALAQLQRQALGLETSHVGHSPRALSIYHPNFCTLLAISSTVVLNLRRTPGRLHLRGRKDKAASQGNQYPL
eukprot:jgi/Botrbrau1/3457/Bobra.139_1s0034.1